MIQETKEYIIRVPPRRALILFGPYLLVYMGLVVYLLIRENFRVTPIFFITIGLVGFLALLGLMMDRIFFIFFSKRMALAIHEEGIIHKFWLLKEKIPFSSLNKIEILDDRTFPAIIKLVYKTRDFKALKVTLKTFWMTQVRYFFLEDPQGFLEELKRKMPHELVSRVLSS